MVVVSSCREMLGSVPQRAQPLSLVASISDGHSNETAGESRRKVGMTSNHHAPYVLGYTRATMAGTKGSEPARGSQSQKASLSNRGSACRGEYVPGPCTHRPSHHESLQHPKSVRQPFRSQPPKVGQMIGVKS